ncbi:hypothetical protein quinque_015801 [Culex quinquefasciatus]
MQEFFVIDSALSLPINGSIIIIEKVSAGEVESYEFPTCEEYLKDLYCRIEVLFVDTLNPNDSRFTLDLSLESNYDQINFSEIPGQPLPHNNSGTFCSIGFSWFVSGEAISRKIVQKFFGSW